MSDCIDLDKFSARILASTTEITYTADPRISVAAMRMLYLSYDAALSNGFELGVDCFEEFVAVATSTYLEAIYVPGIELNTKDGEQQNEED